MDSEDALALNQLAKSARSEWFYHLKAETEGHDDHQAIHVLLTSAEQHNKKSLRFPKAFHAFPPDCELPGVVKVYEFRKGVVTSVGFDTRFLSLGHRQKKSFRPGRKFWGLEILRAPSMRRICQHRNLGLDPEPRGLLQHGSRGKDGARSVENGRALERFLISYSSVGCNAVKLKF